MRKALGALLLFFTLHNFTLYLLLGFMQAIFFVLSQIASLSQNINGAIYDSTTTSRVALLDQVALTIVI